VKKNSELKNRKKKIAEKKNNHTHLIIRQAEKLKNRDTKIQILKTTKEKLNEMLKVERKRINKTLRKKRNKIEGIRKKKFKKLKNKLKEKKKI
jgi:hypothetical protein